MSERLAYQSKIEALLNEWPEKIALMESKKDSIVPPKRETYSGLLKQMRDGLEEVRRKLADYRSASESSGPEARKNLERAWSGLANAYEKALCQFEGVKN